MGTVSACFVYHNVILVCPCFEHGDGEKKTKQKKVHLNRSFAHGRPACEVSRTEMKVRWLMAFKSSHL